MSRQLSVMGFVCTVLVVMIHSTPCPPSGSWQWWIAALFDVLMVPFYLALVWQVRNFALPKALTSNSFPIFLMHGTMLMISLVAIVALGLRRQMDTSLALATVRVLFAVGMSIVVSSVLRKMAPKASARIFGGR